MKKKLLIALIILMLLILLGALKYMVNPLTKLYGYQRTFNKYAKSLWSL